MKPASRKDWAGWISPLVFGCMIGVQGCATGLPRVQELENALSASRANEKSLLGQKNLLEDQMQMVMVENAKQKTRIEALQREIEDLREHEALRLRDLEENGARCRTQLDDCFDRVQRSRSTEERLIAEADALKGRLRLSTEGDQGLAALLKKISDTITKNLAVDVKRGAVLSTIDEGRLVVSFSDRLLFGTKGKTLNSAGRRVVDGVIGVVRESAWKDVRAVPSRMIFEKSRGPHPSAPEPDRLLRKSAILVEYLARGKAIRTAAFSVGMESGERSREVGNGERMLIIFDPVRTADVAMPVPEGTNREAR